jgi:hypothetical protein
VKRLDLELEAVDSDDACNAAGKRCDDVPGLGQNQQEQNRRQQEHRTTLGGPLMSSVAIALGSPG